MGPVAADIPITDLDSPFEIDAKTNVTCYIDNVRYVNPPVPETSFFTATVKNVSDGSNAAGGITWTSGISPTGWARANQYIELQVDNMDFNSTNTSFQQWGVQIYT